MRERMLFAVALCFVAVSASANMVTNAGFEQPISYFWQHENTNWYVWAAGSTEVVTNRKHSGNCSLRIKHQTIDPFTNYGGMEQKVDVTAGQEYLVSFFYCWDPAFWADERIFKIIWFDVAWNELRTDTFRLNIEGNERAGIWQDSGVYPVTAPANAVKAEVNFTFNNLGWSEDGFYLDDIVMVPVIRERYEFRNGSFEEELTGVEWGNWITSGDAERSNWNHNYGEHALLFRGWGSGWGTSNNGVASQLCHVEPEAQYEIYLSHYRDGGFSALQRAAVVWMNDGGQALATNTFTISLTGNESEWHRIGPMSMTSPVGAAQARVTISSTNRSEWGALYIDDVFFRKHQPFMRCEGTNIVDDAGNPFLIRGIGLCGWFFPESYMFKIFRDFDGKINTYTQMRTRFAKVLGCREQANVFWDAYSSNYLVEADIAELGGFGMNTVRIPFNYREFSPENNEGAFRMKGFEQLDRAIDWCKEHGIYIILDMHSCPGGQASEESGDAEFIYTLPEGGEHAIACLWESNEWYYARTGRTPESNTKRTAAIWRFFAERYRDEPQIIGFELINEPHLPGSTDDEPSPTVPISQMRDTFITITRAVREVNDRHIVFVEGDMFAEHIDGLTPPWDDNMAIAFHRYWKTNLVTSLDLYTNAREQHQVPLWMSETGENSNPWLNGMIRLLDTNNIGWTVWGWKKMHAIASMYSAHRPAPFEYCINNLWNDAADTNLFMQGLMSLVDTFKRTNCVLRKDYVAAVFDPGFGVTNWPYAEHSIPGRINATDYDMGLYGDTYYDTWYKKEWFYNCTDWNQGYEYRNDGVDIGLANGEGNGFSIGYIEDGEWLRYTVNHMMPGIYRIKFRAATPETGGTVQLLLDGQAVTPVVNVQTTAGWDVYSTITCTSEIPISVGSRILECRFGGGLFNFSSIEFELAEQGFVDYDGNGISDHWELSHGGPMNAEDDDDEDRMTNLQEYLADTDPFDASSILTIEAQGGTGSGVQFLSPLSSTGRLYHVDHSTNLLQSVWTPIATGLTGAGTSMLLYETNSPADGYYRIRVTVP